MRHLPRPIGNGLPPQLAGNIRRDLTGQRGDQGMQGIARAAVGMCNLYSMTSNHAAIRDLFGNWRRQSGKAERAWNNSAGNLALMPGVFPDYAAPIVRLARDDTMELAMARWGLPSPPSVLEGRNSDPGVTNVRNVKSPHWRRWLGVEHRCLVPFTSFSEPEEQPSGRKPPAWFALAEDRPLAFFAGVWVPRWASVRKVKEGETTNDLFAFLTCPPNAEVGAIHPKAMPMILTDPGEMETWLTAPPAEALTLQRPLPDGALRIVARGEKQDPPRATPLPSGEAGLLG